MIPNGDGSPQVYKIKLASGRILGPIDLDRIRLLILKNQVVGTESARVYPTGDWQDINHIPEIAELLVAKIAGLLHKESSPTSGTPAVPNVGSTIILPGSGGANTVLPELPSISVVDPSLPKPVTPPEPSIKPELEGQDDVEEKTVVGGLDSNSDKEQDTAEEEKTRVGSEAEIEEVQPVLESAPSTPIQLQTVSEPSATSQFEAVPSHRSISSEKTVVFQRPDADANTPAKKRLKSLKELIKVIVIAGVLGVSGYEVFLEEPNQGKVVRAEPIKPQLPAFVQGNADPNKSVQLYAEAMKYYVDDTVDGYRKAASRLLKSAAYDVTNVKSLAMLASTYLNLIDSSNKDENYFTVLTKLIDMSRAKQIDLPETVIADVEFFLVVNKAEAAQNRIVDYTKNYSNFGLEMFYYLALAFYTRGDYANAAKYIGQFPDNKAFSAKIFYLRGLIAEKLQDQESAMLEFNKALKFNPRHAKSHLRIATALAKKGQLKEAAKSIEFLINNTNLLSPLDLGQAYYLHTQLSELYQKWDLALGDIERAVKLDPDNHDYLLEMYTLRAKAGDSLQKVQQQARMYYFLGEGEKLIRQGSYQEALVPLLQARQANDASPLPLVKIGDMFNYLHDVENSKKNYKKAAERAPDSIQVWSKYIQSLIQSYEWEEALKAMDKFRKLPVSQSAIDKAAADLYQKQGRFVEAQTFYRKAMARESIDPDVYIAYAKSLMATKNYKDAPFFFALGLRFDPLNSDAIISTAKCVAETESIDRAINLLQDELKQRNTARADILAGIAELQIQKGAWTEAQQTIDQAIRASPDYAYSWKLQAQIYMNRESSDKDALDKALFAYKSFSERNASDPTGYLERYKIFIKKSEFENAKEELNRIYEIYPKYPNLHYFLGALYAIQGNHKVATEEFKLELTNTPDSPQALIAYGRSLLEIGQAVLALEQFTKAMRLQPMSSDAKQNAGWANFQLKNYQAALSLIRAAMAIDKANPLLFKRLGLVYKEMGDQPNACANFKSYLEMEPDAPDKADFQGC